MICAAVVLLTGRVNKLRALDGLDAPAKMYLLDLGRHTRLAIGRPDGGIVEYGYGEWLWYANLEDHWWRVPATLLWPTQGTLGRREWPDPAAEDRLLRAYAGVTVLELQAEGRRTTALLDELDREFGARADRLIHNERYGLDFVPYGDDYWLFNNSNHAVKAWLAATGHDVSGLGLFASWQLESERP